MKQNRVKQIRIVMAAADVVDNGLSVSRNNVPKAQEIPSLDKQLPAWYDYISYNVSLKRRMSVNDGYSLVLRGGKRWIFSEKARQRKMRIRKEI